MISKEKLYKIAEDVFVGFSNNNCIFSVGGRQKIINSKAEYKLLLDTTIIWKTPKKIFDVVSELININYPEECAIWATNFLLENHHVIIQNADEKNERYSRHLIYYGGWSFDPNSVQNEINKKHVIILGCGGIGNHVAVNLATSGIGKLTLVDDDIIELSNLTRQHMFVEDDVGGNKIDILAREIRKRNHTVDVDKIKLSVKDKDYLNALPDADLIAMSADTPDQLVFWVNEYAVKKEIAYVNICYVGDIAVFGPFYIPKESGCFSCNNDIVQDIFIKNSELEKYCRLINEGMKAPSFVAVNAMSAAMATNDILRFLGGFADPLSLNKRVGIHSRELKIEIQDCSINRNCCVCSHI